MILILSLDWVNKLLISRSGWWRKKLLLELNKTKKVLQKNKIFVGEGNSSFFSFLSNFRLRALACTALVFAQSLSIQFSLFDITRVAKWNLILSNSNKIKCIFLKAETCVLKCKYKCECKCFTRNIFPYLTLLPRQWKARADKIHSKNLTKYTVKKWKNLGYKIEQITQNISLPTWFTLYQFQF